MGEAISLQSWEGWKQGIETFERKIARSDRKFLTGEERRSEKRVVAKLERLRDVSRTIHDLYPDLYTGKRDVELSDEQVSELVEQVCQNRSGVAIRDAQRYLVKGLARGVKELGWTLSVPAPFTSVSVLPSLFNTSTAERLEKYDALLDRYADWLKNEYEANDLDMHRNAGELLFSLVFHSGVTCPGWFACLSEAITQGVVNHQDTYWLELDLSGADSKASRNDDKSRRLILAPVTVLLLRRWYRRWSSKWPGAMSDYSLLESFVERMGPRSGRFRELLAISEANLVTLVPGFLAHYARTLDLGKSVSFPNWARLVTGQFFPTKSEESDSEQQMLDGFVRRLELIPPKGEVGDQRHYFRKLEKLMGGYAKYLGRLILLPELDRRKRLVDYRRIVSKKVRKISSELGASLLIQMMCEYALFLVEVNGIPCETHVAQIGAFRLLRGLLIYASDIHSELTFDEDEWQAIYEDLVESSSGDDTELQRALGGWHEFLHLTYGVARVPLDSSGSSGVDAAILSPQEYEKAKQSLVAVKHEFGRMQLALLILGYRCGLRRSEAWARTFDDFQGLGVDNVTNPELIIRPNKMAGVKSASAVRRLPLAVLLQEDELRWLTEFVSDRKHRRPTNNRRIPLFADPVSGDFRIVEPVIFAELTRLLQRVSGDDRFRFHHLRHSFASLTLVRLLEGYSGEMLCQKNGLQLQSRKTIRVDRDSPLWERAGLGDPSMGLALLSQWMGHSSERVTLRSYSHLLDYLLGRFLSRRVDPELSLREQQALLDKSPTALERFRHRKRLTDRATKASELVPFVRISGVHSLKGRPYPTIVPVNEGPRMARQLNPLLPYRLALLFHQHSLKRHDLSSHEVLQVAADQLDIDDNMAGNWHRRATALFQTPMVKANKLGKFSRMESSVTRLPENFSLVFHAPELSNFPTPPQSIAAFKQMMVWFRHLADWTEVAPGAARNSLALTAESIQRSRGRLQPRGQVRQLAYLRFLKALKLLKHFELVLCVTQDEKVKAKQFWSENSGVSKGQFCVNHSEISAPPANGIVRFKLRSPGKAGSNFWPALRFLIFSGCVIYDAVPGNLADNFQVIDS